MIISDEKIIEIFSISPTKVTGGWSKVPRVIKSSDIIENIV